MGSARTKSRRKRKGPKSRDRHWLYEDAVQSPDVHIKLFDRLYKKRNGRPPRVLKEDFCGTALMAAEWVKYRPGNEAIGVDLDKPTLKWGKTHHIEPLGKDAGRVTLVHADVRDVDRPRADVVAALNFSYSVFKTPKELRKYFKNVHRSLKPGGAFFLDVFGGWEAQMDVTDKTRYSGYTYVWDQKGYDPVTNNARFHIHFKFHGGGGIRDAFIYDWRLWTIPELREELEAAGFSSSDVLWEGVEKDTGEGNGVFRSVKKAENCPGWNAFVVGWK